MRLYDIHALIDGDKYSILKMIEKVKGQSRHYSNFG
jgi:hypothetical protein